MPASLPYEHGYHAWPNSCICLLRTNFRGHDLRLHIQLVSSTYCTPSTGEFVISKSTMPNFPHVRFGFVGAPLAVSVSYYVLFAVLAVYTWLAAPRHAWAGVSMIIFEDLGLNFRYGVAGVISTCSEWYVRPSIPLL